MSLQRCRQQWTASIQPTIWFTPWQADGPALRSGTGAAAVNFVRAATAAGVRRVIYLGGLGDTVRALSEHLQSRLEVGEILRAAPFATTFLRAAVIFGAGGASFEMIRSLVKHLPVMITPRWVSTKCQPIAVDDVINYLVGCLHEERTAGGTFDIGGPEILTYREMMERFAAIEGRKLLIIPVPVLTPRLSSILDRAYHADQTLYCHAAHRGAGQ